MASTRPSDRAPHPATPSRSPELDVRDALTSGRRALEDALREGVDGRDLGRMRASQLDVLLASLYERAAREVRVGAADAVLAAVGSYGRGAVAPESDVDLRILLRRRRVSSRRAAKLTEALLYPLWDAGLKVGHQILEPDEALGLARTDLATATTLLDLRPIAGSRQLVSGLLSRAWEGVFAPAALGHFVDRVEEEASGRHARFGESVYLLEPDVKLGAGGIRDLDGARWAARARFRVGELGPQPMSIWQELVRLGVLVPREAREIQAAEDFLWRVRVRLHLRRGRKGDRLTFDEQELVATELGYAVDVEESERPAVGAERLMQDYYLHARAIERARQRIFARARPPKRRSIHADAVFEGGVRVFDRKITVESSRRLYADPTLAFRVYAVALRERLPVLEFARDAIARAAQDADWCKRLREAAESGPLFVGLLMRAARWPAPERTLVQELHEVGLLMAMVPEFAPVTGRVHHDVYHVYTVDVHSVRAVDRMRSMFRGDFANEHPLASRLAAEVLRPHVLFLATLLHDVGKGYPDASGSRTNHSESGAILCETIAPRLGLDEVDAADVAKLVRLHLRMYHVATRRDFEDPATVAEFAQELGSRELLRYLYLLTIADISTTSPTAMTAWKARMLEELYVATDAQLAGVRLGAEIERISRAKAAARIVWSGESAEMDSFLGTLPARYLLANPPVGVVAHLELARGRALGQTKAAVVPSRYPNTIEVCVVADDAPGLLARIARVFAERRLELLAAEVYSRVRDDGSHEALDLFWIRDDSVGRSQIDGAVTTLSHGDRGAARRSDPTDLAFAGRSPWARRPTPQVNTEIVIDDRASPRHTIIEVFGKDRPGFLYLVAEALHRLNLSIVVSKVNTEGTRVVDVFYVNELDGSKVMPGPRFEEIRTALRRAIEPNESTSKLEVSAERRVN